MDGEQERMIEPILGSDKQERRRVNSIWESSREGRRERIFRRDVKRSETTDSE